MQGELLVKAQCLPFNQIPHTTRLFADFLAYSPSVRPFYPRSPYLHDWIHDSPPVRYDASRRAQVADILTRQNKSWNASAQTLSSIEKFRNGAAAVVTGQQVGLFGGPMFALYKALTAVKLVEQARSAGIEAVPVFWLATYDHDLAEVNHASFLSDAGLQTITTPSHGVTGAPVSDVRFGDEILPLAEEAAKILGENEVVSLLREAYRPGVTLGTAFARLFAELFADWGVILLDASDPELHRVAEPVYRAAIDRAEELDGVLLERNKALERAGYHQQVKVTPSSVLLFTLRDGARMPMRRHSNGSDEEFLVDGESAGEKLSRSELIKQISTFPERFSPNVLLRPVVQDYLLPTLVYTGGAAETAYFAQAGAVYEVLAERVTPIVPRFSATVVEPKVRRLLDRHQLTLPDVFGGLDSLRPKMAARNLPQDLRAAFDRAGEALDVSLASIREKLELLDRTLVDAAETASSKMRHQLERLHTQAARAEAEKGEVVKRHAENLTHALYPNKGLQEREVAGIYFVARYGRELLHQIYETIRPDCHDHQVLDF